MIFLLFSLFALLTKGLYRFGDSFRFDAGPMAIPDNFVQNWLKFDAAAKAPKYLTVAQQQLDYAWYIFLDQDESQSDPFVQDWEIWQQLLAALDLGGVEDPNIWAGVSKILFQMHPTWEDSEHMKALAILTFEEAIERQREVIEKLEGDELNAYMDGYSNTTETLDDFTKRHMKSLKGTVKKLLKDKRAFYKRQVKQTKPTIPEQIEILGQRLDFIEPKMEKQFGEFENHLVQYANSERKIEKMRDLSKVLAWGLMPEMDMDDEAYTGRVMDYFFENDILYKYIDKTISEDDVISREVFDPFAVIIGKHKLDNLPVLWNLTQICEDGYFYFTVNSVGKNLKSFEDDAAHWANYDNIFFNSQLRYPSVMFSDSVTDKDGKKQTKQWRQLYDSEEFKIAAEYLEKAAVRYAHDAIFNQTWHVKENFDGDIFLSEATREYWVTVYPAEDRPEYMNNATIAPQYPPHTHPGAMVSCNLYVNGLNHTAPLGLIDPRARQFQVGRQTTGGIPPESIPGGPFHQSYYLWPEAGDILCYGSYLEHFVPPHMSPISSRVVISMDLKFAPKQDDQGWPRWDTWFQGS